MGRKMMLTKLHAYCHQTLCVECPIRNVADHCRFSEFPDDKLEYFMKCIEKTETIKIKYFEPDLEPIGKIAKGDWIDLRAAETVELSPGEHKIIRLGVGMILPDDYEAHVLPRSSTFSRWGILMTNSMGVIDNSYSGDGDEWKFSAYATRATVINKGDRIAQFRIIESQPTIEFEIVDHLNDVSRGGFGSTGKR